MHQNTNKQRTGLAQHLHSEAKHSAGFTLVELLIVMVIIGIISGSIITAINPKMQLGKTQDTKRIQASREISKAMYQRLIDSWELPSNSDIPECDSDDITCAKPICKEGISDEECHSNGGISLGVLFPTYIASLVVDPVMQDNARCNGYMVYKKVGRPKVFSGNMGKLLGDESEPECDCGDIIINGIGDGIIDTDGIDDIANNEDDEECDDGDTDSGDGCSATMKIEAGYTCTGEPSDCTEETTSTCGNGILEAGEVCDSTQQNECFNSSGYFKDNFSRHEEICGYSINSYACSADCLSCVSRAACLTAPFQPIF